MIENKPTVSDIDIIPCGNFWNKFIGDSLFNGSHKFGKNQVASNETIVAIPAINWFSVKLDRKPPIEMYAIASSINPINTDIVSGTFVIPPAKEQRII